MEWYRGVLGGDIVCYSYGKIKNNRRAKRMKKHKHQFKTIGSIGITLNLKGNPTDTRVFLKCTCGATAEAWLSEIQVHPNRRAKFYDKEDLHDR